MMHMHSMALFHLKGETLSVFVCCTRFSQKMLSYVGWGVHAELFVLRVFCIFKKFLSFCWNKVGLSFFNSVPLMEGDWLCHCVAMVPAIAMECDDGMQGR